MHTPLAARTSLLLAMSLVAATGCGSDGGGGGSAKTSSEGTGGSSAGRTTSAADRAAASRDRVAGAVAVSLDAGVQSCLYDAGFTPVTPPKGAVAAFQHPDGVNVALPSSAADQATVAAALSEDGTPARVAKGSGLVVSGREDASTTALDCGGK